MRLLPVLLINLVTVAVAIVAYDQLRGPEPTGLLSAEARGDADADLAARVTALEAARQPMLKADGPHRLVERLDRLEEAVRALRSGAAQPAVAPEEDGSVGRPQEDARDVGESPGVEDVERFRQLQAASRRLERMKREEMRVGKVLDGLGVRLSGEQRRRLLEAHVDFEERRNEIWTSVKTQAAPDTDWPTVIAQTQQVVRGEFVQRISSFLPAGDAEQIAAALHPDRK